MSVSGVSLLKNFTPDHLTVPELQKLKLQPDCVKE